MNLSEKILKNDERAVFALRALYQGFGYSCYKMSKFEEYDLYVRNKDFLQSDGIITFTDATGKLLALKPDVTLSIINNSKDLAGNVQKVYYNENVYRISKSSRDYKEIMQTGLECVGDIGQYEICEVLSLALKSLAIISERFLLDLSHVGFVSAVLEESGVPADSQAGVLSLLSRKNADGLLAFCEERALSPAAREKLLLLLQNYSGIEELKAVFEKKLCGEKGKAALNEFEKVFDALRQSAYLDRVRIDFSTENDMSYYSGIVFKGYIDSVPTGVLSGGQYDKLMKKMGRNSGAIGFAVYLDALERFNHAQRDVDVDVLLLADEGREARALKEAERISEGGETVFVSRSVTPHLKYRRIVKLGGEDEK